MYKIAITQNYLEITGDYLISHLATKLDTQEYLYLISGDFTEFTQNYPAIHLLELNQVPPGDWFQNSYPEAPGDDPVERYFNGVNNVTDPNAPKWNQLMPAISQSPVFFKILTTTNSNAFSSLQTVFNYRNMELFKQLARMVVLAIPEGLTEEESLELDSILVDNNFPSFTSLVQD